MEKSLKCLNDIVVTCARCPRLVAFRESVPKRASYKNENYWRRPVPGFGDIDGSLLILGLAPAAHGGNRTGRLFTGDESARFLMKALFETGFTNQDFSTHLDDGLKLLNCFMTAIVKCVPPKNLPLPKETLNCSSYFENEFFLLKNLKSVLIFGGFAFKGYLQFLKKSGAPLGSLPIFKHGLKIEIKGWPTIFTSYHPSPQNTYTGKLTHEMLISVLQAIKRC